MASTTEHRRSSLPWALSLLLPWAASAEAVQRVETPCAEAPVVESCIGGLCLVPSGCFTQGVPRSEPFAAAENDRQVEVTLSRAFLIGQTEVTRAQWRALGLPEPVADWRLAGSSDASTPPPEYGTCEGDACPVTFVGFEDAAAYANLLSEREGLRPCYVLEGCQGSPGERLRCAEVRVSAPSPYACEGYRLPTEAEWEFAARAGTRGALYSGELKPDPAFSRSCGLDPALDAIGWYCGNSGAPTGQTGGRLHEVAQKKKNGLGLYDVSGNAWEWTSDLYDSFGYGDGPRVDPLGGVTRANDLTARGRSRVARGGAFDVWSFVAKSGRRASFDGAGGQAHGFRIVRSLDTAWSAPAD